MAISIGVTFRNYKRHSKHQEKDVDDESDGAIDEVSEKHEEEDGGGGESKQKKKWNIQITANHESENSGKKIKRYKEGKGEIEDLNDSEYEYEDEYDVMDEELDDLTPLLTSFLKKRGEDLLNTVVSKVCSEETHQALKTIQKILRQFSDHGVVDVFSMHSTKDILLSTLALSRLQYCYTYTNKHYTTAEKESIPESIFSSISSWVDSHNGDGYDDIENEINGGTPLPRAAIDKDLLSDIAHYAVFANAAYGWKGGLALTGKVHIGDLNSLLTKTGIDEKDVIAAQWHSKTHRPAFFLVRDLQRKKLVLSIRGTLSARDILTDLCCTADDFCTDDGASDDEEDDNAESVNGAAEGLVNAAAEALQNKFRHKNKAYRAHHGMLESARGVAKMTRKFIASELAAHPDFSVVIVGHSLGGGTAAVLGAMWQDTFPGLAVYAYGCPCVGPLNASPTTNKAIISIVGEGDPFSCLSLGHLADISVAVSQLCRHQKLRDEILKRSGGRVEDMREEDLFYCYDAMEALRKHMNKEKFFPPGRILYMGGALFGDSKKVTLKEVSADFFRDLKLHPRMLDLSRHAPIRYESALQKLWLEMERDEEVTS